ncbi:hypothetical protein ABTX81_21175 [Kitasatospora sp. NPDC097605]|uniref:hypothetical protein n=1 Tax=Kitasatospora sp. NPDC097605 TaxID=3157226 RepID=UPI003322C8D5
MRDRLAEVFALLGPGHHRFAGPTAWAELEAEIGTDVPEDCKAIVDACAPMQINGGEDMVGPNSSAFHPGPVLLEPLPVSPDDRPAPMYGPERGM